MFSLKAKIAESFSENIQETEIVSASNDIENLCTGLSRKIWQKRCNWMEILTRSD